MHTQLHYKNFKRIRIFMKHKLFLPNIYRADIAQNLPLWYQFYLRK